MSTKREKNLKYENLKIFVSSAVAATTSRCSTAPLDRLKIIFQTQQSVVHKKYDGIYSSFKKIYVEDGILGYWRGNGANVIKVIPEIGFRFLMFEYLKTKILTIYEVNELNATQRLLSGGISGMVSQFVVYPMEVVRSRLAVSEVSVYKGIYDCTLSTYRSGIRGFYVGLTPSLLGIFPYAAIDLTIYDFLRTYYIKNYDALPTPIFSLVCGAIASSVGQFVAYPLDLTRRRLQVQGVNTKTDTSIKYTGTIDCIKKTLYNEGFRGLYKGMTPNLLKVIPAVSMYYVVYEQMKKFYGLG
jgi:solute carrier family 25 phosphate transporter 23/24/25/41